MIVNRYASMKALRALMATALALLLSFALLPTAAFADESAETKAAVPEASISEATESTAPTTKTENASVVPEATESETPMSETAELPAYEENNIAVQADADLTSETAINAASYGIAARGPDQEMDDIGSGCDPQSERYSFEDKAVTITSRLSTKRRLDVPCGSKTQGTQLITWDAHWAANQRFILKRAANAKGEVTGFYIVNVNSGFALDIPGGVMKNGAKVIQWPLHGGENQIWTVKKRYDGSYSIQPRYNHGEYYELDVSGANEQNGAEIILWKIAGSANQHWDIEEAPQPIADGSYTINTAVQGNRSLDIQGGSKDAGGRMILWDTHYGANQRFNLRFNSSTGYYYVASENSGFSIDVFGGSTSAGAKIIQWPTHGGLNQQWAFVPTEQGTFYALAANSGMSLDVCGGAANSGGIIIQYPLHGGLNQQWILTEPNTGRMWKSAWKEWVVDKPGHYETFHHPVGYEKRTIYGPICCDWTPIPNNLAGAELEAFLEAHYGRYYKDGPIGLADFYVDVAYDEEVWFREVGHWEYRNGYFV